MSKSDPAIDMLADSKQLLDNYFTEDEKEGGPIQEQGEETPPVSPSPAVRRRREPSGEKPEWTNIRITTSCRRNLKLSMQAYTAYTGKEISTSSFIDLMLRRGLPRVSKEAADFVRQILGSAAEE